MHGVQGALGSSCLFVCEFSWNIRLNGFITRALERTHTHTHIYIYIYIRGVSYINWESGDWALKPDNAEG